METYKASLGTTAKIITAFVFGIVTFSLILVFFAKPFYAGLIVLAVPLLLLIFSYPYRVNSYAITNTDLIINRQSSRLNRVILLTEIESVRIPAKKEFARTIRTMGNGGLFGFYGQYYNKSLKDFRMYATRKNNLILLVLKNNHEKIVISPDDAAMADELQKHLGKPVKQL